MGRGAGQRPLGQLAVDQQGGAGKIGGTEPKTMDDLFALLDKAKAAGVIPLALGGQNWQEATMFDSVVLSTGGPDFYNKAMNQLDDAR